MLKNKIFGAICLLLVLISTSYTVLARPQQHQAASQVIGNARHIESDATDNLVLLNFEHADIQTVIKAISKLSGKNFVIDPKVKGTINIVSEKPIARADSYTVLEAALRMQGFATVEANGVIKVVPEAEAHTYGMHASSIDSSYLGDQLITKIFVIDHGSATQLANALRSLIAPNNTLSIYQNSNAIIVTDYASNILRISKIVTELQTAATVLPTVVKLQFAYAEDVAQILDSYTGSAKASNSRSNGGGMMNSSMNAGANDGPTANITTDLINNTLIISSNVGAKRDELAELAINIDKQSAHSNNNLHVVYLRNAEAAHIAEVLNIIVSSQNNPDLTPSSASRELSDTTSMFQGSSSSSTSSSTGTASSLLGSNTQSSKTSSNVLGKSSQDSSDSKLTKILVQAEPSTNSLIIQAPEAVYRNLRMIIDKIDVRRVQVMLEALIADVNTTEQGTFGIQWIGGAGNNNIGVGVISNYGGNGSSLASIAKTGAVIANAGSGSGSAASAAGTTGLPNEVYIGLVTGTTTVGGQTVPGISALADMIAANSAGNIIGRPTLLTLDNEEASLFVGSNIGLPSGSYATTGGSSTVNPFTTVDRQDIGTVLRLKPLVTQNGNILLSVYQEDSSVDPNQPTGIMAASNGPNLLKRSLKTQILVNDGQIIALGGMTQDTVQLQTSGIPGLSAIPYLGWLFSWQSRTHSKQNLVIFIRPVIIRNEEGAKALTEERYRYIIDQQNSIQATGNILLPQINAVNLENQVPYGSNSKATAHTTDNVSSKPKNYSATESLTTSVNSAGHIGESTSVSIKK